MSTITIEVGWLLKERKSGLWVPQIYRKNLVTTYGITALAGAPSGTYTPPVYLVIDTTSTTLAASYSPGVNSITTQTDPTIAGDTQLVLGVGLATQETVTFTAKSGSGPYTWTLSSATTNSHTSGDAVVRAPTSSDTITSVLSEAQYDPTYAAGLRAPQTANYSPGTGQNTMQFFIAGVQATNVYFAHVGLSETQSVGSGNLHNYAAFGYNHNNTNDVEIDVTWTFTAV